MAGENTKTLVEERANSWILDYYYHYAWEEFCRTNEINLQTTRDFIQCVVTQPYSNSTERKQKVQILLFLCRLSDGCDHTTRYTLNSDLTALEEALKNVSVIESLVSETHIETLKTLRTTVKKQAVLVCCRANDFLTGQDVFNRLWETDKNEKNVVEHLTMVLASLDKDHNYIHFNSYNKFLKKAVSCLTEIHNTFSIPYLLQQADYIVKKCNLTDDIKHSTFSHETIEHYIEKNRIRMLSPREQQNLEMKLKLIREAKKKGQVNTCRTSQVSKNTHVRNCQTSPVKKSPVREIGTRAKRRKLDSVNNNSLCEDVSESENNSSTNEKIQEVKDRRELSDDGSGPDEHISPLRERIGLSDTASILSVRGRRIPWNYSETVVFFKALQRQGVGNWSKIKDDIQTFRTGVQLKDRWRVISKDKQLLSKLTKELHKK